MTIVRGKELDSGVVRVYLKTPTALPTALHSYRLPVRVQLSFYINLLVGLTTMLSLTSTRSSETSEGYAYIRSRYVWCVV